MTVMPARLRTLALITHVTASVGWLGAVLAVLGLAVTGLTSDDTTLVRGVYLALDVIGRYVLVPLALASLLTGLIQSLGTTWGLFRHYWVIIKLIINVVASVVLLLYTDTLRQLADIAASRPGDVHLLRGPTVLIHTVAALLLLAVATVLSITKPRGTTRYGWRKQQQRRTATQTADRQSVPAG